VSVLSSLRSPSLEYYRKQARALLKAAQAGDSQSLSRIRLQLPEHKQQAVPTLADVQHAVARENGFASWPRFKEHLETRAEAAPPAPEAPSAEPVAEAESPDASGRSMSDEAVRAKTGHDWAEWFAILDAAGGQKMTHREIVAVVSGKHGVGSWWRQMVAVQYEQARGLRVKNQSCAGDFQVSVSKTIAAPAEQVFEAWNDPALREQWLPGARMTVRKASSPKSLRVTWHEGGNLDVYLYPKGEGKCSCTADHNKLGSGEEVDRLRAFWAEALARLKTFVES
jgi:hypothetical protein